VGPQPCFDGASPEASVGSVARRRAALAVHHQQVSVTPSKLNAPLVRA
jgi:hypothetical protein